MRLPEPFVARMREELGAEQGAALCAALDTAPSRSIVAASRLSLVSSADGFIPGAAR